MPPPAEGLATRFVLGPALRTQPDRRLVGLVREGYETAFEEIVRRYGRPLTRYAAAIVGSRGEDVTQDAFSKALLALRRDDAEIELRPWLFRIVRNTALNELRDRPPSPEVLAEAIASGRDPAEALERREELADLIRRLRSLPEPQRAAIVMRELEGLSHEEIAAALGLSDGAARQAIYRARRALRDGLGLLLPLPLLRLLIDHGGEAAIAGVGAGGATAAASGAGAGIALKAGVVTVVLAGSVGTGIALQGNRVHGDAGASAAATPEEVADQGAAPPPASPRAAAAGDDSGSEEDHAGDDESGRGGSSSGDGHSDEDEVAEPRRGLASDDSGPGPSSRSGRRHGPGDPRGGGRGGPGPSHGDDRGGHRSESDSHSDQGPGGRHSGSAGGGNRGSGSSGPGSGGRPGGDLTIEQPPPPAPGERDSDEDSSDPGSGSGPGPGSRSGDSGHSRNDDETP